MKCSTNGPSHHDFNGHTHRALDTECKPANMLEVGDGTGWGEVMIVRMEGQYKEEEEEKLIKGSWSEK